MRTQEHGLELWKQNCREESGMSEEQIEAFAKSLQDEGIVLVGHTDEEKREFERQQCEICNKIFEEDERRSKNLAIFVTAVGTSVAWWLVWWLVL